MKKYEMTDETKVVMGHTLHRIRALKSFRAGTEDDTIDVDNGDSGGWIEKLYLIASALAKAQILKAD